MKVYSSIVKMKKYKGDPRFYKIIDCLKDIHSRKSDGYAPNQDPLANLKECERMGIPAYKGVLMRMLDKVSRLIELSKGKPDLVQESFQDSLRDLAIYSILCEILYEEKNH